MAKPIGSTLEPEVHVSPQLIGAALMLASLALYLGSENVHEPARRGPAHTLVILLIVLAGIAWIAGARWERPGRWLALAILFGAIQSASMLLGARQVQGLFAVAVALAAAVAGLRAALFMAAAASAAMGLTARLSDGGIDTALLVGLTVVWGMAGAMWAVYRPVNTVVRWVWEYQERGRRLLEEARQRKGELAQALANVAQANRQLALAEERAATLRLMAEEARRAKAEFAAQVSHEFRTPLNMIIGLVGLMVEAPELYSEELPPDYLRDLEIVHRNCQHLANMVNDVLDLSRAEAGQLTLHRERTSLAEIIESALEAIRPLAEKKKLQLASSVPAELPLVFCDRTRILEVLLNLVSNAARVTSAGRIVVQATLENEQVLVGVQDTGPGIPPEAAQRMFEPFYQVPGSGRWTKEGSGLGLAISKQCIELHGGRIWLESEPGVGTTFFFQLPVSPPARSGPAPWQWIREDWPYREDAFKGAREAATQELTRPRVVVCDDTHALLPELLRAGDAIEFVATRDMGETERALAECPAHVVLLNTTRGADAWQPLDNARHRHPHTLFVGCSVPGPADAAVQAGALGQLTKPVTPGDLARALAATGTGVRQVLAVDDDGDFARLLRAMLARCDPNLVLRTAANGEEALAEMERARPDLVLLDIVLPDMDGWQLLSKIKGTPALSDIPVWFLSAQDPGQRSAASGFLLATTEAGVSPGDLLRCSLQLAGLTQARQPLPGPTPG